MSVDHKHFAKAVKRASVFILIIDNILGGYTWHNMIFLFYGLYDMCIIGDGVCQFLTVLAVVLTTWKQCELQVDCVQ